MVERGLGEDLGGALAAVGCHAEAEEGLNGRGRRVLALAVAAALLLAVYHINLEWKI